MRRSAVALLLLLALVAGACSSDDDDDDGSAANTSIPEDTTTSSSTTEPQTVAPDIIPTDESQIDEAYVEGVLEGLAGAALDALVATRNAGVAEETGLAILSATRSEQGAIDGANSLARIARDGFDGYRENLEPTTYAVKEVLTGSATCIVAEVTIDSSGYFSDDRDLTPPPGRTLAVLAPASVDQRASGLNPTAWITVSFPVVDSDDALPDCSVSE